MKEGQPGRKFLGGAGRWIWIGWFGLALIGLGCDGGSRLCKPDEEQACDCPAGVAGVQTCQADGQAWGACVCPCQAQCTDLECGPDGCGGSCGSCDQAPAPVCQDAVDLLRFDTAGTCRSGACQYTAHLTPCTFGCAAGACNPDPCDALACDTPPGPCHEAQGTCQHDPEPHCVYAALADDTPCADENYCNGVETCQQGACLAGPAVDCRHLDDGCNLGVCDEATALCLTQAFADGSPCSDGSYCNGEETCYGGACQAGAAIDCSELDSICADGDCSEQFKRCVARPKNIGQSCSDGLVCNGAETCDSRGACVSSGAISCVQPANACWVSTCTEQAQGCEEHAEDDQTPCSDGDSCTLDDVCQDGICVSGQTAADLTPCDDGDPCTANEVCQTGQCIPEDEICSGTVVFMAYMDADNNLDSFLTSDWHEMEAANVDDIPWLRVFVVIDHSSSGDSRFYEVHNGSSTRLDAPHLGLTATGSQELNMADGATVRNFVLDVQDIVGDGAGYFLMLSDHGDGWRRYRTKEPEAGLTFRATCSDDHSPGDMLYTAELQTAVAGLGLQLIGFDACLEGMVEIAYQLRNDALVMVGSQELEPGDGWQFTDLLTQFGASGDPSPYNFGQIVVDTYMASYASDPWATDVTQAAYDLTRMDDVAVAADAVATEFTSLDASNFNAICNDMEWYGCYWGSCEDYADMIHIALRAKVRDPRANDAVYDAFIDAVGQAVIHSDAAADHPNSHGMNVYFPCGGGMNGAYNATNLFWAADTTWDEMLSVTRGVR